MAESRVVAVTDALIARASALANYRLPAGTGVAANYTTVWDGAEWHDSDDLAPGTHLIIGWAGVGREQLEQSAYSTWTTGPMAGPTHPRDEVVQLTCRSVSQYQDTQRAARVAAMQGLADVSSLLRADPSLGINTADTIGGVRSLAFVTAGHLWQYLGQGFNAEAEFTVTVSARV